MLTWTQLVNQTRALIAFSLRLWQGNYDSEEMWEIKWKENTISRWSLKYRRQVIREKKVMEYYLEYLPLLNNASKPFRLSKQN